jgi:hypothetical protein
MPVDKSYALLLMSGFDYKDLSPWVDVGTIPRDELFKEVLESFDGKPLKIFQIGAIESLSSEYRIGSGWSEMFWGDYINTYGGELTIVDINIDHIAHSNFLANNLKYPVFLHIQDAIDVIDEGYDLYYLDGADISQTPDAHEQTLNQFKKIENTRSVVLVDDAPTKAELLRAYLEDNNIEYTYHNNANGMLLIDMRNR